MTDFTVFPAIDIRNGKCVRLFQGKLEEETIFHNDPVEVARIWQQAGARFLHVVDLDGAFEGSTVNKDIITKLIQGVSIPVQVGGGIRDLESARLYVEAGAKRVIIGTSAFGGDSTWLKEAAEELGESLVVGIDAKRGRVAVSGWTETKGIYVLDAVRILYELGVPRIIYTNITKDGTMSGPDYQGIEELVRNSHIPVIASGGVRDLDDVLKLQQFERFGVEGVIIGMAFYKNKVSLTAIYEALAEVVN